MTDGLEQEAEALVHLVEGDRLGLRPCQKATTTPDFWRRPGRPEHQDPTEPSWEHLMPPPTPEWEAERREQRLLLKALPRQLKRLVNRVFNTHHRGALLDLITAELGRRAAERGRLFETNAEEEIRQLLHAPRSYVPATDWEEILRELADDGAFRLRLFKLAKATTKQARAINTWTSPMGIVETGQARLPRSGAVRLDSVLGLVAIPLPHRPPEALLVALGQRLWATGRRGRVLRLLDWGAGNSAFTAALLATSASKWADDVAPPAFTVDEVDVLGDAPPNIPFVSRRHFVPRGRVYDFALIQLPPPCANRGGYRDRHKGLFAGRSHQERRHDLGRLGVSRWASSAPRVVRQVLESVGNVRNLTILIPLFEVAARPEEASPTFAATRASIVESLRCTGLSVSHDFETYTEDSSECWKCLIASKAGSRCLCAEDEAEIDEVSRALR